MSTFDPARARVRLRPLAQLAVLALLGLPSVGVSAGPLRELATGEYYADRVPSLPSFPFELHLMKSGQELLLRVTEPFARPAVTLVATGRAAAASAAQGYWVVGPSAWEPAMAKFVRGLRALGWDARYVSIESILDAYRDAGDDADALRAALKDAWGSGVAYALLAGDGSVLPVRYASDVRTDLAPTLDQLQLCDLFFADFDGNWDVDGDGVFGEPIDDAADMAAELALGRLPVSRAEEAADWSAKWERYAFAQGDLTYLGRALGLTSDQMRDDADGTGQAALVARTWPAEIAHDSISLLEKPTGAALEPEGPWASEVIDIWNAGWGIVQMFVHGRWDGFALKTAAYNTWPKSYLLTDPVATGAHGWLGQLHGPAGIVYSVACNQAAYDAREAFGGPLGQRCVASELLALPDGGAVAFVGYSRWGWVYTSYRVAEAFWEGVFDSAYTAAAALQMAKLRFPYLRDVAYGHNLYGDPALSIWRGVPAAITVDLPDRISAAGGTALLTASADGQPLAATVTVLSSDGEVLLRESTDGSGMCTLGLGILPPQSLLVTVSRKGYAPFQGEIQVSIASGTGDDYSVPQRFHLDNYPNPFNSGTSLRIESADVGRGRLAIYNQLGQRVRTWELGIIGGRTTVDWNGTDEEGRALPSGIYFARLEDGTTAVTRKLLMLK